MFAFARMFHTAPGLLKRYILPIQNMAFSAKTKRNHHSQGNAQVYNASGSLIYIYIYIYVIMFSVFCFFFFICIRIPVLPPLVGESQTGGGLRGRATQGQRRNLKGALNYTRREWDSTKSAPFGVDQSSTGSFSLFSYSVLFFAVSLIPRSPYPKYEGLWGFK